MTAQGTAPETTTCGGCVTLGSETLWPWCQTHNRRTTECIRALAEERDRLAGETCKACSTELKRDEAGHVWDFSGSPDPAGGRQRMLEAMIRNREPHRALATRASELESDNGRLKGERDGLRAKLKASRGRCIFHQDDYCEDCEEVRAALGGEGK